MKFIIRRDTMLNKFPWKKSLKDRVPRVLRDVDKTAITNEDKIFNTVAIIDIRIHVSTFATLDADNANFII